MLVISEVDGILTNGRSPFDELGICVFKEFNLLDFEAISEIQKMAKIVFISRDNRVTYNLFRKKNIPFYWAEGKNKYDTVLDILRRYSTLPDDLIYIGCSFSDIPCLQIATYGFCPSNAISSVKSICNITILNTEGGNGVLSELVPYIKNIITYRIKSDG